MLIKRQPQHGFFTNQQFSELTAQVDLHQAFLTDAAILRVTKRIDLLFAISTSCLLALIGLTIFWLAGFSWRPVRQSTIPHHRLHRLIPIEVRLHVCAALAAGPHRATYFVLRFLLTPLTAGVDTDFESLTMYMQQRRSR
jgi:hypothetical protein